MERVRDGVGAGEMEGRRGGRGGGGGKFIPSEALVKFSYIQNITSNEW